METAVIFLITVAVVKGAGWSYHTGDGGPESWGTDYPICNMDQQSPIDIETHHADHNPELMPFYFIGYESDSLGMSLSNNGHSAVVTITSGDVYITSGSLPGESFKLAQFHFHWGEDLWTGSEHLIDGHAYPAELHLVHFNTKYGDLTTAVDKPDGLAVLGIFLEAGDEDNWDYNHIISGLSNIIYKDESVNLQPFPLMSLMPDDVYTYYRYQGSLTTPACYESVTWTVFKDTVKLSPEQLSAFRNLRENKEGDEDVPMVNNYRPVQPLEGRDVWMSMYPNPPTDAGNRILGDIFLICGLLQAMIFRLQLI